MMRLSMVVLLLAATSTPVSAATPAQTVDSQTASAAGNPSQVICERVEKIGTRLGSSRVCMTRAEWAEQRRLNRDTVDRAQQTRCESLDPKLGGNSC